MSHDDFLNAAACSHVELGGRPPLSGLHLRRDRLGSGEELFVRARRSGHRH
jgi:hypothetical protein